MLALKAAVELPEPQTREEEEAVVMLEDIPAGTADPAS